MSTMPIIAVPTCAALLAQATAVLVEVPDSSSYGTQLKPIHLPLMLPSCSIFTAMKSALVSVVSVRMSSSIPAS